MAFLGKNILCKALRSKSSAAGGLIGKQIRCIGGGVPEHWGKPSEHTEGTEFLGTPPNHLELVHKRPLSPDVFDIDMKSTHFSFPYAALSSITNRATGIVLSGGVAGMGLCALSGGDVGAAVEALRHYTIIAIPAKFCVSFSLIYHYMGGLRHIWWDSAKHGNQTDSHGPLEKDKVETQSKILFGASGACALVVTFIGTWESLTNELERAYQSILDVTQVYFATILIDGDNPHRPPKYFLAGHSGGELRLFSMDTVIRNPSSPGDDITPLLSVKAHSGPVYNLAKMHVGDDIILLSCGYDGTVCGWSWEEMHAYATSTLTQGDCVVLEPKFRVHVPKADKVDGETAINAIGVDEINKRVFAGDGSGAWHMWGLEKLGASPERSVQSHSAMVLDVKYSAKNVLLATSSEDGSVCIWDCRHSSHLSAIDPSKGSKLPVDYKQRGNCVYPYSPCVSFDPDANWLLCGSSRNVVCFWNIRANMCVQQLHTEAVPHAIGTHGNEVYLVGEEPYLNRFNLQGQQVSRTQVVPEVAYSIEVDRSTQTVILSGTESTIQVVSPEGQSLGKVTSRKILDTVGDNVQHIFFTDSDEELIELGDDIAVSDALGQI